MSISTEMWAAIVGQVVGFVVWIARLEMKVKFLEKEQGSCMAERQKTESSTVAKLNEIGNALAELRTDVKWLIHQKGGRANEETN